MGDKEHDGVPEPPVHPDDLIVRMHPFGPDKRDKTIARARKDEREQGDGVLALSVFSVPHDATADAFKDFMIEIPVSGRWMYVARRGALDHAGVELRWDPTSESDRHYLLPVGVVSDTHSTLETVLDTLETVFGERERNPGDTT